MTPNEILASVPINLIKTSGIYMIYCISDNKAYIGRSKEISKRWIQHKSDLTKKRHDNSYLQNIYNKYGKDSFTYFVLENCIENITIRESYYLNLLDEKYRINLAAIVELTPMSQETRDKISKSVSKSLIGNKRSLGRKQTIETRKKISEASIEHWKNEDFKKRVGNRIKEVRWTKEARVKASNKMNGNQFNLGRVSPKKGKPMSLEHKEKLQFIHRNGLCKCKQHQKN